MQNEEVVERLNQLLQLESSGLLTRLEQVQPFVEWADAAAVPLFKEIVADEEDFRRLLTEAILAVDGVPAPPAPDAASAAVHYLDARYLLPRLIEDEQRRIAVYERLAGQFPPGSPAGPTVSGILERHRQHVAALQELQRKLAEPAAAPAAVESDDA